jgi:hypothetical protein
MGWKFRRALGIGLFRINLSKTGIGFSVGTRGFRFGRDATGRSYTHLSLPGTGVYRRDYLAKGRPFTWSSILKWAWPSLLLILILATFYLTVIRR